jgi:hypothetical protein
LCFEAPADVGFTQEPHNSFGIGIDELSNHIKGAMSDHNDQVFLLLSPSTGPLITLLARIPPISGLFIIGSRLCPPFFQVNFQDAMITFSLVLLGISSLGSALPLYPRSVTALDTAAFQEAQQRDNTATRAFSNTEIKVRMI